jgi:hypothetical protein
MYIQIVIIISCVIGFYIMQKMMKVQKDDVQYRAIISTPKINKSPPLRVIPVRPTPPKSPYLTPPKSPYPTSPKSPYPTINRAILPYTTPKLNKSPPLRVVPVRPTPPKSPYPIIKRAIIPYTTPKINKSPPLRVVPVRPTPPIKRQYYRAIVRGSRGTSGRKFNAPITSSNKSNIFYSRPKYTVKQPVINQPINAARAPNGNTPTVRPTVNKQVLINRTPIKILPIPLTPTPRPTPTIPPYYPEEEVIPSIQITQRPLQNTPSPYYPEDNVTPSIQITQQHPPQNPYPEEIPYPDNEMGESGEFEEEEEAW